MAMLCSRLRCMHLISNFAQPYSLNKLKNSYKIGSVNTVVSYIQYLENAYFFFSISKFDYSYKKRLVNEKKVYVIDTGFERTNTIKLQDDHGRLLENLVFLYLRRQHRQIHYHRDEWECDFILTVHRQVTDVFNLVCNKTVTKWKERSMASSKH